MNERYFSLVVRGDDHLVWNKNRTWINKAKIKNCAIVTCANQLACFSNQISFFSRLFLSILIGLPLKNERICLNFSLSLFNVPNPLCIDNLVDFYLSGKRPYVNLFHFIVQHDHFTVFQVNFNQHWFRNSLFILVLCVKNLKEVDFAHCVVDMLRVFDRLLHWVWLELNQLYATIRGVKDYSVSINNFQVSDGVLILVNYSFFVNWDRSVIMPHQHSVFYFPQLDLSNIDAADSLTRRSTMKMIVSKLEDVWLPILMYRPDWFPYFLFQGHIFYEILVILKQISHVGNKCVDITVEEVFGSADEHDNLSEGSNLIENCWCLLPFQLFGSHHINGVSLVL